MSNIPMPPAYDPVSAFAPRRLPGRESYERTVVHAILDEAYVAHVAYEGVHGPEIIPTFYVRDGEQVLIHLSRRAGLAVALAAGKLVTLAVTLVDGLVLARSAFHHSMNYRSVIIHGQAVELTGAAKAQALDRFVERIEEGRSKRARPASAQEMKATGVFAIPLVAVVAKQRFGGPKDDAEDMALPIWAGVIPLETQKGAPEADLAVAPEASQA